MFQDNISNLENKRFIIDPHVEITTIITYWVTQMTAYYFCVIKWTPKICCLKQEITFANLSLIIKERLN